MVAVYGRYQIFRDQIMDVDVLQKIGIGVGNDLGLPL